jgi:hypothetical protein
LTDELMKASMCMWIVFTLTGIDLIAVLCGHSDLSKLAVDRLKWKD